MDKDIIVCFCGKHEENWTEGNLTIDYVDPICVLAHPISDDDTLFVGLALPFDRSSERLAALLNSANCSATYSNYFQAAANAMQSYERCRGNIDLLPRYVPQLIDSDVRDIMLVELLRIILDEMKLSWMSTLCLLYECYGYLPTLSSKVSGELSSLQSRTASLSIILRKHCESGNFAEQRIAHDSACEDYRSPLGALPTGERLRLFVRDSGLAVSADCIISSPASETRYSMTRHADGFTLEWVTPDEPAAFSYVFELTLPDRVLWLCPAHNERVGRISQKRERSFRLTVYRRSFDTPDWFKKSLMYHIFPDRFARDKKNSALLGLEYHRELGRKVLYHENWDEQMDWQVNTDDGIYMPLDFFGGTLRGISENLDYIKSLGVNVIYLNPIFEAASNHRYDASDYLSVDPILGRNSDFVELCEKAEARSMRIILDIALSHTGADSIYFNRYKRYDCDGAYNAGKISPYYEWYDFRRFPDEYRCWWGFEALPEINEYNRHWRNFAVNDEDSVIRTWLRRGAAGYRLDVADELPDDCLNDIRSAAKSEHPDCVIIGEVWEDAITKMSYGKPRTYALGDALDSVMNYPLRGAILDFFYGRTTAANLRDFLLSQRLNYPKPMYYALMNLLSSHDVERVRTSLSLQLNFRDLNREQQNAQVISDEQAQRGATLQILSVALTYFIPGVPCIYYGDECGMEGMLDPFNRGTFSKGRYPLVDQYKALGALRENFPIFADGDVAFYAPHPDVLLILRHLDRDTVLCCINRSEERVDVVCDLYDRRSGMDKPALLSIMSHEFYDGELIYGDGDLSIDEGLADISLPPLSAASFILFHCEDD